MEHVFLYGPPGSGKSTVGTLLARDLGWNFIDLDRIVESRAGMTIVQIMERRGEAGFRDDEAAALRVVLDEEKSVIALGGGTLLRDENRALAEDHGQIVLLDGSVDELLIRLQIEPAKRPLLTGNLREKLESLVASRKEHYDSFPRRLCTDDRPPDKIVWELQRLLGRFHLRAMGDYDVVVEAGGLDRLGRLLTSRRLKNPIIVTDTTLAEVHLGRAMQSLEESGHEPRVLTVPPGESQKNLRTVEKLWQGFLQSGLDRGSTVIALGGGVIGDIAGFAAATFMRGVNWAAVPTSLLAMVDASLGGKTGFDLPEGKNLIGAIHPPRLVLADPALLGSLPEAEFRSGLAEVVKHGIISDPALFQQCQRGMDWMRDNLEDVVRRTMAVKIQVIEEDPYEKGRRAVLNLGHTVGHAIELVSGFRLRHGEAISIGLVAEAKLAERLGVAEAGLGQEISGVLSGLGLPVDIPPDLPRAKLVEAMRTDKKRSGGLVRFALPAEIGRVELVDVVDLDLALEER